MCLAVGIRVRIGQSDVLQEVRYRLRTLDNRDVKFG